jgi:hypothetical protein
MGLTENGQFIGGLRGTIDLAKSALALLPRGAHHDEIESKLALTEDALQRSNVQLARNLNMSLCNCTFPPQIMLWKEQKKADVCPSPECRRVTKEYE